VALLQRNPVKIGPFCKRDKRLGNSGNVSVALSSRKMTIRMGVLRVGVLLGWVCLVDY